MMMNSNFHTGKLLPRMDGNKKQIIVESYQVVKTLTDMMEFEMLSG